jgi:hypothetical protein
VLENRYVNATHTEAHVAARHGKKPAFAGFVTANLLFQRLGKRIGERAVARWRGSFR